MTTTANIPSRLAAVWFADIVGYSRLASHDERSALDLVDVLRAVVTRVVAEHGGRLVKLMGDGALAEFASADVAVRSALALVRVFAEQAQSIVPAARLRVGVHLGEVATDADGDLYGDGVNTAARLQQSAGPGEVVVSEDVWRSLRQRSEHRFTPLGQRRLKGLAAPVRVYRAERGGATVRPGERATAWLRHVVCRRTVAYTAGAVLAVVLGYTLLARGGGPGPSDSALASLAVLPLANVSPDAENEYFADGMTEELIAALGRVEGLHIVSRTSAFAFKGRNADVREVGEKLGVGAVLEGSVRRAGDRMRIAVRLVDAGSGYQLWSETYDRGSADVFAVQEEISRSVVAALAAHLGPDANRPVAGAAPLALKGTDDLEAYNLYLQGRYFTNKWDEANVRRGIGYFERAIERDPSFARAYAGLADAHVWLLADASVEEALPKARAAARRSLELDDSLSEAHYAIARIASEYDWNYLMARRFDLAEAPYRKALELDRDVRFSREHLGVLFVKQGRFREAIEMFRASVAQRGPDAGTLTNLAWGHAMTGDEARRSEVRSVPEAHEPVSMRRRSL